MATEKDVLDLARSQIGVCENPMGSNRGTPYHAWYGSFCQGWQWCAIFVTWIIWHVDQALFWGLMTAYSGDYLKVGRVHLREIDISQIRPGDICIWDKPIGGITDHIGFVESVTPTTFTTIEGNSGDCVKRNANRPRVQTSACHYYFVRPDYSKEAAIRSDQPQEDKMEIVKQGEPRRFPVYCDGGRAVTYIDLTDESTNGKGATVRLWYRPDDGRGDSPIFDPFGVPAEASVRINCWEKFKVSGPITLKVEVLSGGPVGVTRRQEL